METWQIAVIVVGALVVVSVVWIGVQRRRTERLTGQFGPEYQRTVAKAGDQREAERELAARSERVKGFEIRALSTDERNQYLARWKESQAHFVDDPSGAISQADVLVQEVMGARGYPTVDFEQRAADVSVDHPHLVDEYRAAHAIAERHMTGGVETEDLRQAMVHYRALFDDLLETDAAAPEQAPELPAEGVPMPPMQSPNRGERIRELQEDEAQREQQEDLEDKADKAEDEPDQSADR